MAEGARRVLKSDIAVSVTGIAGPDSDESGRPVGFTYIALDTPDGIFIRNLPGRIADREVIRQAAASNALDMIRRYLTGKNVNPEK